MAVTFTEQFEKALSEQKGVRSDKVANASLADLVNNTTGRKDNKAVLETLEKAGLSNVTIKQINTDSNIKEKFGRFFEAESENNKAKTTIKALQNLFQESGYQGGKGRNPVRSLITNVIGTAASADKLSTETIRKVPSPYPFETYSKLKTVITNMLSSPDKATRLAGTQLAMHVIGGYRPSDFKSLKIENIDFKTGVVSDLEIKDKGRVTTKAGYFPKIIRDIILKEIDPSGQGLVFPTNNEVTINAALKKANINTEYTTAGKKSKGTFTLEDTRKLNETHLTSLSYDEKDPLRLAATLRANKTTIGQYVASGAAGKQLEELFAKSSTPFVAFSGTSNHAQYLKDIGVESSNGTKRYKILNDVVEQFPLDRVEDFQEKYVGLSFDDGNKVISNTLSPVNDGNAKLYQEKSAANLQVEINESNIKAGETAVAAAEGKLKQSEANILVKKESKEANRVLSASNGKNHFANIISDYSVQSAAPSLKDSKQIPITTNTINPKTGINFTKKEIAVASALGIFTVSSSAEAANLAGVVARDEMMELGLLAGMSKVAPEIAKTVVGRALPLGAVLAATESSDTNLDEVQQFARQDIDKKYFDDPNTTNTPIYKEDRRLPERSGMYDKSALPSSPISYKQGLIKTRDTGKSLIPNYTETQLSNLLSGGKTDMQAGFATRPNRSELNDETERQLKSNSFLGAT